MTTREEKWAKTAAAQQFARDVLKWDVTRIAQTSTADLLAAQAAHVQTQENTLKVLHLEKYFPPSDTNTPNRSTVVKNQLLEQLVLCYCTNATNTVGVDNLEHTLFTNLLD